MFSLKNIICVWSSIDHLFFKCVNQSSVICFSFVTNFINQSFSVRSRLSNDRHAARLRGSLTIWKCILLLLFKMNATRDWNRKGSSCGGVLGQLSHEVLEQHCSSSGLRLNYHTSNLFLTIVITLHLFCYNILLESHRSEIKECFTRATTRHNSKQSNIHHTSSPELSFSLFFYSLCYRISGSTPSLLARQSQRFLKTS